MALKGNLRDFTITQLLNLINLANKTGSLIVEGPSETALVTFRDGKLAYAQMGQEDGSLGAILHKANVISSAQFRTLKSRAAAMGDKELGLLLINSGYVTQDDILEACRTTLWRSSSGSSPGWKVSSTLKTTSRSRRIRSPSAWTWRT